jgi:hypothetical protein
MIELHLFGCVDLLRSPPLCSLPHTRIFPVLSVRPTMVRQQQGIPLIEWPIRQNAKQWHRNQQCGGFFSFEVQFTNKTPTLHTTVFLPPNIPLPKGSKKYSKTQVTLMHVILTSHLVGGCQRPVRSTSHHNLHVQTS